MLIAQDAAKEWVSISILPPLAPFAVVPDGQTAAYTAEADTATKEHAAYPRHDG